VLFRKQLRLMTILLLLLLRSVLGPNDSIEIVGFFLPLRISQLPSLLDQSRVFDAGMAEQ
jgi:hypothetical protein